jgi:hypothetical protein
MEEADQRSVRARAGYRCEYCHFPEAFAELPFHLDHIIAQQHGGETAPHNLAFACCFCNRYKGPNLSGIDSSSGEVVLLFNPRQQLWDDHFVWRGARIFGTTPCGRAGGSGRWRRPTNALVLPHPVRLAPAVHSHLLAAA